MIKTDKIYHVWEQAPPLNQEFEFTCIDTFVNERKIKVDAIKIDVDSYDYEVYGAKCQDGENAEVEIFISVK